MKLSVLILFASALMAVAQEDIRMVSGKRVDVQPVNVWLKTQAGVRPMQHWKRIKFEAMTGKTGAWTKYKVSGEAGEKEILVANVSQKIQNTLARRDALVKNTEALEQRVVSLAAEQGGEVAKKRQQHAVKTPGGRTVYLNESSSQSLDEIKATRNKLTAERDKIVQLAETECTDLAMSTGKTFAGLEIWDCGRR